MRYFLHLFFLFFIGGTSFISGCTKQSIKEEDSIYAFVKKTENVSVEKRLIQYSRGTISNHADYDRDNVYDRLNIAFMTDSHLDLGNVQASEQNVSDAIDFLNNVRVSIAAVIEGGDLITKVYNNKNEHISALNLFFEMGWKSKAPLLYTKGNHDLNTINVTPEKALTDEDWDSVWYNRAETEYGIVRNLKKNGQKSGYYYYDLEDWKVRIVSVDCFDVDWEKMDDEGNILYWGGTSYYIADEQFNWIANCALDFDDKREKDWGVIVFTHFYQPAYRDGTSIKPVFESVYRKFNDMLIAFNNQASFSKEYIFPANSFYNLNVKADWSRYAGLTQKPYLICVLSGHIHTDDYFNWDGVQHIITANQFCGETASDIRLSRVAGTSTQNLFDIINIDLKQRKIRVIRYGAGVNCYGEGGDRFVPDGLNF